MVIINVHNDVVLIAACALFGFSVGNLITLPSLIVQREFDPRSFGVLISLITAINQITYRLWTRRDRSAAGSVGQLFAAVLRLHRLLAMLIAAALADDMEGFAAALVADEDSLLPEVQPLREHRQRSVGRARPFFLRPVAVQFDAVLVGIAQIKRLADAVVAGAVELDAGLHHAMQRIRQRGARGIEDRGVEQPGGARRGGWPPLLSQVLRPIWW